MFGQPFAEQRESPVAITTEHSVVDTRHQRRIIWQRRWHRNPLTLELFGSIGQIQLIEHAMVPVTGQRTPVLLSELTSLVKESSQISPFSQFVTIQRFIDTVTTHLIVRLPDGHHIDTLARFQADFPIVLRHTRDNVIMGKVPTATDVAILYPNIAVLLCKRNLHDGILHKNARMGFTVEVHNLPLVVDEVLESHRRRNHLSRRAEMIELPTSQRDNDH